MDRTALQLDLSGKSSLQQEAISQIHGYSLGDKSENKFHDGARNDRNAQVIIELRRKHLGKRGNAGSDKPDPERQDVRYPQEIRNGKACRKKGQRCLKHGLALLEKACLPIVYIDNSCSHAAYGQETERCIGDRWAEQQERKKDAKQENGIGRDCPFFLFLQQLHILQDLSVKHRFQSGNCHSENIDREEEEQETPDDQQHGFLADEETEEDHEHGEGASKDPPEGTSILCQDKHLVSQIL